MEQWEKDLDQVMRLPPAPDKGTIQRIMKSRLDDRSTAVTCGALAELGLVAGLATLRQPNQREILELFWKRSAKYGTFGEKIRGAKSHGLIGPTTEKNLHIVRKIRNVFAHSMSDIRFTTPAVSAACAHIVPSPNLPRDRERRQV